MGNEQGSMLNREPLESPCKLLWASVKGEEVQGREGHASAAINNKVYFYGGSGLTHLFELSVFDIEDNKWRDIQTFGDNPGPLCNPSLNAVGSILYLFGGLNRETGWNNDVWSFDTDTEKWNKLSVTGIKPSPRDKHTSVVWGSNLVVFGGFGPAVPEEEEDSEDEGDSINFTWFNDVYLFDTETHVWDAPNISLVGGPVPRAAHSATVYKDRMFVFGGKDSKARNQDLFALDLKCLEWSRVEDAGARPPPSSFHCTLQYKQFALTYGGRFNDNTHSNQFNVLDCETGGWYNPVEGTIPPPRGQSTLSLLANDTLVMFGGSDNFDVLQQCCQVFDNHVYQLDCTLLQSVEVPVPREKTEEQTDEQTNEQTDTPTNETAVVDNIII